ncbi:hypothetical protein ACEQ8H_002517 [Pleosporales sp. CAS-2024a]
MLASTIVQLVCLVAAPALAATTTTATVLIPNWCITASSPTVTVVNSASDLTTYSYSCSVDSSAASSASAAASAGRLRASAALASAGIHHTQVAKRDDGYCYNDWNHGWGGGDWSACIPWEVTQGPSIWAVHYTLTNIVALDQECTFGAGGVASGPATCTASGRLDPGVWGNALGVRTHTFASDDVQRYWIKDVVRVTAGSAPSNNAATATATATATRRTGTALAPTQAASAVQGAVAQESAGRGVVMAIPTGLAAMYALGAGGVLFGALAL